MAVKKGLIIFLFVFCFLFSVNKFAHAEVYFNESNYDCGAIDYVWTSANINCGFYNNATDRDNQANSFYGANIYDGVNGHIDLNTVYTNWPCGHPIYWHCQSAVNPIYWNTNGDFFLNAPPTPPPPPTIPATTSLIQIGNAGLGQVIDLAQYIFLKIWPLIIIFSIIWVFIKFFSAWLIRKYIK